VEGPTNPSAGLDGLSRGQKNHKLGMVEVRALLLASPPVLCTGCESKGTRGGKWARSSALASCRRLCPPGAARPLARLSKGEGQVGRYTHRDNKGCGSGDGSSS